MNSWIKDCELLDFINVDICFCINEDFYYGPSDVISMAERNQTTPLPSVTNKSASTHYLRSLKAEQNPEKLLQYFQEVLRLAKNYGKKDYEISHYFWLKLSFWRSEKGLAMDFPWYDTLGEMTPLLEKIAGGEQGTLLKDEDENWLAEIIGDQKYIYAREGDPEEGDVTFQQKIPRERLGIDCREAIDRTRALIAYLSQNLGQDFWTAPKYPADLFND